MNLSEQGRSRLCCWLSLVARRCAAENPSRLPSPRRENIILRNFRVYLPHRVRFESLHFDFRTRTAICNLSPVRTLPLGVRPATMRVSLRANHFQLEI